MLPLSHRRLVINLALVAGCVSPSAAQVPSTPPPWQVLFFLNFGVGGEWQNCESCPGMYPNPLWGPTVRVGAGASNTRFAIDESLIAWWQVFPLTIESKWPAYRSQYLMTEVWYQLEPDDAIKFMIGAGIGKHRSSFGDDGRGGALETGVDLRLFGTSGASLRWQTHLVKSLSGNHQAFSQYSLPAGRYRPLLVITSLSLWTL